MIKRVLAVVTDGVKRWRMLQMQPGVAPALVTASRFQILRTAKVSDGVRQRFRAQTDVHVGFEGEHHVLHEEPDELVSGFKSHDTVLHPAGDVVHQSDGVLQAVERA